jgi:hypothetical protein
MELVCVFLQPNVGIASILFDCWGSESILVVVTIKNIMIKLIEQLSSNEPAGLTL